MSIPLPPLPDPYGRITTHTITGQQFFYRWPESPYLDNAKECIEVVTYSDMRQYAAAVSAAKDAEIAQLREYIDAAKAVGIRQETIIMARDRRIKVLEDALCRLRSAVKSRGLVSTVKALELADKALAARAALGDKTL